MTTPPTSAKPGRPHKYTDVVRAARLLADRIRDNRDIDTSLFELEIARLRAELKKVDR